ncbi:hypothetical protein [Granulicella sibirica]|nr:hypothetical protein [Granulicella sibirica]
MASLLLASATVLLVCRSLPDERGIHTEVAQASSQPLASVPHIGPCPIFPADNVWNIPIDTLPKDPRADRYTDSIGPLKPLHPDFGTDMASGIPFTEAPPGTLPGTVTFDNREESDLGRYPIPPNAPIEGNRYSTDSDHHILVIDSERCLLYELWLARPQQDGWLAGSGIRMDLTSNALRTDGFTSADAAGLPILPGLVRYDEVASGQITHALRFTLPHTQKSHIWPARHDASHLMDANLPPLGIRFRLRADFDLSKYSKTNQVILTALKRYGMFLADNGSPMFLTGVPDRRWDDHDLHKLTAIASEDFEPVDESTLQILPDSARVDPVALKH